MSARQKGTLGPSACHCDVLEDNLVVIVASFLLSLSLIILEKSASTIKYLNTQGHLDLRFASFLKFHLVSEASGQLDGGKSADLMILNFHRWSRSYTPLK